MMLLQEISRSFERNALKYFSEDFEKHKNYLLRVAFGRNSRSMGICFADIYVPMSGGDVAGSYILLNFLRQAFNCVIVDYNLCSFFFKVFDQII